MPYTAFAYPELTLIKCEYCGVPFQSERQYVYHFNRVHKAMLNNIKQHITVEQVQDLSEKSREKLFNWLYPKPKGNLRWPQEEVAWHHESFNETLGFSPLLSIGQMMELLMLYPTERDIRPRIQGILVNDDIEYGLDFTVVNHRSVFRSDEFCDALWDAVKEVLEKETTI